MQLVRLAFALFFCLGIFFFPKVNGQRVMDDGNWEAVILYNSVPYLVEMTPKGMILMFKKELPVYFGELQAYIEEEFGQDPIPVEKVIVADIKEVSEAASEESVVIENIEAEVKSDPIIKEKVEEVVEDTISESIANEGIEVEDDGIILERKEFHYNLIYPGQIAVFNQGQLGRLDEIIEVLNENPVLRFSMRAYASDNSAVSETVNRNRLTGIEDYLKVKGIDENRIINNGLALDAEKSNTIHIKLY